MAAPKGNKFWLARATQGRDKIFSTPSDLWQACLEYFEWVDDNPLYESKLTSYQGVNKIEPVEKMRAMTIDGLCLFLDIDVKTWSNYKTKNGYEDFFPVITQAEQVIRSQKFAGAAADLLNANIIARDLGLADKTNNEHTGKDGGAIETRATFNFIPVGNSD